MVTTMDRRVLRFLRDIAANNNKSWFEAHRDEYEAAREAFHTFGQAFIDIVYKEDPKIGEQQAKDCTYRINRDVRFSADKSPYKRHFGLFAATGGRKSRLPGYYLHIEPGNSLFCSGNYGLTSEELRRLRTEIANFPEELDEIVCGEEFASNMELSDEDKLKTKPKGYEIAEGYEEYLKYKTLNAVMRFTDAEVESGDFIKKLKKAVRLSHPLNDFYRRALETEVEEDYGL